MANDIARTDRAAFWKAINDLKLACWGYDSPGLLAAEAELEKWQARGQAEPLTDDVERLRERVAVFRAERDHARAGRDAAVKHIAAIHMRLYPEPFVDKGTGLVYTFRPSNPHEYLQALSDQIRAIPDTIAGIEREIK